jgi:hypothetical protein
MRDQLPALAIAIIVLARFDFASRIPFAILRQEAADAVPFGEFALAVAADKAVVATGIEAYSLGGLLFCLLPVWPWGTP